PTLPGLGAVFETGAPVVTRLLPGTITGAPVIATAIPMPGPDGGPARHAIGMTVDRARVAAALQAQNLPEGGVAAVLDGTGVVAARTRGEAETLGRAAGAAVLAGLAAGPEGTMEGTEDGEDAVIAFARAPETGYAVTVAVPEAAFARDRNAALARLAGMTLPVTLVGLALAALLGIRLRASLAGLSGTPHAPRLQEVDDLARALAVSDAAHARIEQVLRERSAWLEATQRAAAVGTWSLDLRTGELRWSDGMWRLYGLDPWRDGPPTVELFRSRLLEDDLAHADDWVAEAEVSGRYEAEFRIRRPDGEVRWIRAQGAVEQGPDGRAARVLAANLDITERRALEEERERLVAQKDLLVQEVHHRVKNSLQLVQSMLRMQARGTDSPEVAAQLQEAASRIVTIASVHRRLYEGAPGEDQDAADHLAGLAEDLGTSLADATRAVRLEAERGMRLPSERMASLGLLATELVTNALKHGAGDVVVGLRRKGEVAELAVQDTGPGFPPDFDPTTSRGLGMRVALAMARQLRGELRIVAGPAGRVVVAFPI
ncbi:MAG TPA: histidine kinase dimerization/phosphoacceptor domain -containing protein, partial [Acetobacteraceae bacterium]|nr:histidine kinase dimerization/phosphoacceptor domain -containing protein [Acetobacteraceae bacterium]